MGVYFGYYFTLNVFLELHTHPQMLRSCYLHYMTVFSSTLPCVCLKNTGEAEKGRKRQAALLFLKRNFLAGAFVFLTLGQAPLLAAATEKLRPDRSGSEVMLFHRSTEPIPGILGATEYLKGLGFHEENTKKERSASYLRAVVLHRRLFCTPADSCQHLQLILACYSWGGSWYPVGRGD